MIYITDFDLTDVKYFNCDLQRSPRSVHFEGYVQRFYLKKSKFFRKTSFCVLQVLLRNFTNTVWQLYIDFYTIRIVFASSFQLCIPKVANLKKIWQF